MSLVLVGVFLMAPVEIAALPCDLFLDLWLATAQRCKLQTHTDFLTGLQSPQHAVLNTTACIQTGLQACS